MYKLIALLLLWTTVVTGTAQQLPQLTKRAAAVKRKVESLSPDARISVIPLHGQEAYGRFVSSTPQDFTFLDVDRKMNATIGYEQVRKVKDGFGGYNPIRGRHTDRTKAVIALLVVAGLLGGVIAAAATAKN